MPGAHRGSRMPHRSGTEMLVAARVARGLRVSPAFRTAFRTAFRAVTIQRGRDFSNTSTHRLNYPVASSKTLFQISSVQSRYYRYFSSSVSRGPGVQARGMLAPFRRWKRWQDMSRSKSSWSRASRDKTA